jgi:D-alanyl-D-alanine carboxypeptidase/Putative peptidoglycan binding domain
MVSSQNGWAANDRAAIASFTVPGGKVALRKGAAGSLLAWAATRWHNEVEPLVWPGNWGYAERPIRGATALSNHASGTAIDLNAPKHPLATDPRTNFSPAQIAAVRRIMADTGGVLRWGGDYTGRKDGMHVEINDRLSEAQVAAAWARVSGAPTAAGAPAGGMATLTKGMQSDQVKRLQEFLNAFNWQPPLPLLPTTGLYGDQTVAVVKAAQAQCGVTGPDANGEIVGPRTIAAFAARGARW